MYAPELIYGLDIETDTTINGLDQRVAPVVAIVIADAEGPHVFRGEGSPEESEVGILTALQDWLHQAPTGLIVTWNGSCFDLPFLAERAKLRGVDLGLRIEYSPHIPVKYEPLPGLPGGYHGVWERAGSVPHAHFDIAPGYRSFAAAQGISHSLKPVCTKLGLHPVEVDRARIHELSGAELDAYVGSDGVITREAAIRLLDSAPILAEAGTGTGWAC